MLHIFCLIFHGPTPQIVEFYFFRPHYTLFFLSCEVKKVGKTTLRTLSYEYIIKTASEKPQKVTTQHAFCSHINRILMKKEKNQWVEYLE